ncbi:TonB-dependent receptor plug domain-containing protein [Ferruginibacter lapsinanis]|uniref:TonB-dependent receptor plug domain-containing protein n=1 Tax=Ferruginibacter lapsinanis TaxID=563172 RepID=UPI001E431756|nr:TonB-dependent receptor plug domain-containing protein [Ferruginibacter lapsinanis]UEG50532.1 TonB-dependent receptor plug domain-containing protein [Ferruginibacter lapsinanis]
MKRLLLAFIAAFLCISTQAQQGRLFDQSMIIKECAVDITTKGMFATTWIELEFYNDRNKEAEALYNFHLAPGQAVTGFQLMLGDAYREGSIEESWKARQAYSNIVGKRMDPALLRMTGQNYYTLNIYPVPAKGSRKVKIKIEELLRCAGDGYKFDLGLLSNDSIGHLSVNVNVTKHAYAPISEYGLLKDKKFVNLSDKYTLTTSFNDCKGKGSIAFLLPKQCTEISACMESATGAFFLKTENKLAENYTIDIKKLRVYWDCSASMIEKNKKEFTIFLKKVITRYKPDQLTIVPFNQQLYGEKIFTKEEIEGNDWEQLIDQIQYKGATQFGILNFDTKDDLILVFTDGRHTWGKKKPLVIKTPVAFITTGYYYNYRYYSYYEDDYYDPYAYYNPILNYKNYYLYNSSYDDRAIEDLSKINIGLIAVEDESGNQADMRLPQAISPAMLLVGTLKNYSRKIILKYGFGDRVLYTQQFDLQTNCYGEDFDKAKALINFEYILAGRYWCNTLAFGIDNKMVTWQTSYIVLEKIDDYVKYNITPPADLLQSCLDRGYVQTDYRRRYEQMKKTDNAEMLKLVVKEYNQRIDLWGAHTDKIDIESVGKSYAKIEQDKIVETEKAKSATQQNLNTVTTPVNNDTKAMDEVVVIGYGTTSKSALTGSVSSITYNQLKDVPFSSVGEALTGRVSGLQVTTTEGAPGAELEIKIRGGSSITQSNAPLYVIDGIPSESGLSDISVIDIERIDVLKDAASTAIYGSRGANGVILVTTKSGNFFNRNYSRFTKLKNQNDVGYMVIIKNSSVKNKYQTYLDLEKAYKNNATFYLDMALHFYEHGLTAYTDEMIQHAAETGYGDVTSQTSIAFIYEHMKQYDKAIEIYQNLSEDYPNNLRFVRDAAWAYYQSDREDTAIRILYNGIIKYGYNWDTQTLKLKDIMLAEMNMMIALHKGPIDISYIPKEIIKSIPADIRIIVESSTSNLSDLTFDTPRGYDVKNSNTINRIGARLHSAATDYMLSEFQVKDAPKGKYRISLSSNSYYGSWYSSYIRIIKINNFGTAEQSIDTDIISLDNQSGTIEIESFKIK